MMNRGVSCFPITHWPTVTMLIFMSAQSPPTTTTSLTRAWTGSILPVPFLQHPGQSLAQPAPAWLRSLPFLLPFLCNPFPSNS